MKMKKLFLPILMMVMMLVSTVAFAASSDLSITASKSSGQVAEREIVTYTAKTSSTDAFIESVTTVITNQANGEVISTYTANTKSTVVNVFDLNQKMPVGHYANIKVNVTVKDRKGGSKSQDYFYTMDMTNNVTFTASPESGKINKGQTIRTSASSSLNGVGIAYMNVKFYDGSNKLIKEVPFDFTSTKNNAQATVDVIAPNQGYAKVRMLVTATDEANRNYTQDYNYTMDTEDATFDVTAYDKNKNTVIANNSKIKAGLLTFFRIKTSNTNVGARSYTLKVTNVTTNTKVFEISQSNNAAYGIDPWNIDYQFPNEKGQYKVEITIVDINGKSHVKTLYFTIEEDGETGNRLTLSSDYASGSKLALGSKVTFTSQSSNARYGTKTMELKIYKNGSLLDTKIQPSSYENGSNPMNYSLTFKNAGTYRIDIKATDVLGNIKEGSFEYIIGDEASSDITISFSPAGGKTVEEDDEIKITASAVKSGDRMKSLTYVMYDEDGKEIKSYTKNASDSNTTTISYTLYVPEVEDSDYITIKATGKLVNGVSKSQTEKYYLDDEDDDDDDDDDETDKGVINPDGEDLAIDLWTDDNERMYELESDIKFTAYYYNFEKSSAKNVVIEIEVPDGFKVKSKSTSYGTVTYKNNIIKYTIGTVPSKELREVHFTLNADDDDLSETDQTIVASIYSDKDELEDTSTQRIYIYENGEKGTRKAFITGYTDGTFRPDNNITREEVAAMMARAFNYAANSVTKTFSDVKTTSWSYRYIAGCATNNIIKGYTDKTFKPLNNITISELYAMTYRAMKISEEEKSLFVPKRYKKNTTWETNYVAGLVRLGMLNDKNMKDLDVDDYATRAQVVYLVSRVQFRNTSSFKPGYYFDVNSSYWNAKDIEAASYNYSYKRSSNGKESVTTQGTFLDTNSNYIK